MAVKACKRCGTKPRGETPAVVEVWLVVGDALWCLACYVKTEEGIRRREAEDAQPPTRGGRP